MSPEAILSKIQLVAWKMDVAELPPWITSSSLLNVEQFSLQLHCWRPENQAMQLVGCATGDLANQLPYLLGLEISKEELHWFLYNTNEANKFNAKLIADSDICEIANPTSKLLLEAAAAW